MADTDLDINTGDAASTTTSGVGNLTAGSNLDVLAQNTANEKAMIEESKKQPVVSDSISRESESGAGITNSDLFPGMNQPINVGNSSSKTLGSQPIFVASGQYVPFNVLNKREEAINKAAEKRLQRQLKFDPGSAAKYTNTLYQPELNKKYSQMSKQFIEEAKANHGKDWDLYLNSQSTDLGRRWSAAKRDLNTLADQGNQVFQKVAEIQASKEKGGKTLYSKDTREMADKINRAIDEFEGGKTANLTEAFQNFESSYDFDAYIKDNSIVKDMQADIKAAIVKGDKYLLNQKRESYKKNIENLAESLTSAGQRYEDDPIITKQVIIDKLTALLGWDDKVTQTISREPATSAYIGKEKTKQEEIEERAKKFTKAANNPNGETARSLYELSTGVKLSTGEVVSSLQALGPLEAIAEVEALKPTLEKVKNQLSEYYSYPKNSFGGPFTGTVEKTIKKAIVDYTGIHSTGVKVSFDKETDKVSVTLDGKTVDLDANKNDVLDKDLTDFLMENKYGSTDFYNDDYVLLKTIPKAGSSVEPTKKLVKVGSPEYNTILNGTLNRSSGENKKLKFDDVNKRMQQLRGERPNDNDVEEEKQEEVTEKQEEVTEKKATFEEYQKTETYSKVLDKAKKDYPKATESQLVEAIKKQYK